MSMSKKDPSKKPKSLAHVSDAVWQKFYTFATSQGVSFDVKEDWWAWWQFWASGYDCGYDIAAKSYVNKAIR